MIPSPEKQLHFVIEKNQKETQISRQHFLFFIFKFIKCTCLALENNVNILKVDFDNIQRTGGKKINQNYGEEFQIFNYLDAFCRN